MVLSDDEYKKELDIEGGERFFFLFQNRGFNIFVVCGGMVICGQCKVKFFIDVGIYMVVEIFYFDMCIREVFRKFLEQGEGDGYV